MKRICLLTLMLICGAVFSLQAQDAAALLETANASYESGDNNAALQGYQAVLDADASNYEAAWKLSRAYVDIGETFDDKDKRKEYYQKGREFAEKATQINPAGAKGFLSMSIAIGRVALDAGAKERVRLSKEIKKNVDKSLELDDTDDISWHVLGRWHRRLATLSWIEKRFANMFLGGVPKEASVEESARCFEKAIELHDTYINHYLELGMTYMELDRKADAKVQFEKVLSLPETESDDAEHKQTAQKLLKKVS